MFSSIEKKDKMYDGDQHESALAVKSEQRLTSLKSAERKITCAQLERSDSRIQTIQENTQATAIQKVAPENNN